jgi:hypothetical protein
LTGRAFTRLTRASNDAFGSNEVESEIGSALLTNAPRSELTSRVARKLSLLGAGAVGGSALATIAFGFALVFARVGERLRSRSGSVDSRLVRVRSGGGDDAARELFVIGGNDASAARGGTGTRVLVDGVGAADAGGRAEVDSAAGCPT